MFLLSIIVSVCLGHSVSKGIDQKRKITANLEIVRPWEDCVRNLRTNENSSRCDVELFDTEDVQLENMNNIRYALFIEIGSDKQKFKVSRSLTKFLIMH